MPVELKQLSLHTIISGRRSGVIVNPKDDAASEGFVPIGWVKTAQEPD